MRDFVLIRLAAFVGAVLGTALLLFLFLDLLPGAAGSDQSGIERFFGLFAGSADAWQRLGVTLPLALLALVLAGAIGTGLGLLAIWHRSRWPGRLADIVATLLAVIPPFWLGMALALLFAGALKLVPASGFVPWSNPVGALASLVLPALALGLPYAGQVALRLRTAIAAPSPPEIRRLRLEGMNEREAIRRLGWARVRAQLPGVVGRTFAALLIGATLVESVFYLPGLGRLVLGAAERHDLVLLRGGLFVLILVAALGMLAFALLRLLVDPRVRR